MISRVTLSEEAIISPRWSALTIVESPLHPGRELEIPQREALVAPRLCFCCVAVGDGLGAPHTHAVSTRLGRKHGPYAGVLERGPHETLRMDVKKVRVFLKRSSAIELRLGASSVGVDIFPCGARPPAREARIAAKLAKTRTV